MGVLCLPEALRDPRQLPKDGVSRVLLLRGRPPLFGASQVLGIGGDFVGVEDILEALQRSLQTWNPPPPGILRPPLPLTVNWETEVNLES